MVGSASPVAHASSQHRVGVRVARVNRGYCELRLAIQVVPLAAQVRRAMEVCGGVAGATPDRCCHTLYSICTLYTKADPALTLCVYCAVAGVCRTSWADACRQ